MMRALITAAALVLLILVCVLAGGYPREWLLIPRVPSTFLGTVGAMTLVAVGVGLNYPYSLLILGAMSLIALSKTGRDRWRVWLTIGIVNVMPSLFLYREDTFYHYRFGYQFARYGQEADLHEFVGALALGVIAIILAWTLYAKRFRPRIMGRP
jgi:hypothetical protein